MAYESMICDMIKVPGHNGDLIKPIRLGPWGRGHSLRGADPPLAGSG